MIVCVSSHVSVGKGLLLHDVRRQRWHNSIPVLYNRLVTVIGIDRHFRLLLLPPCVILSLVSHLYTWTKDNYQLCPPVI